MRPVPTDLERYLLDSALISADQNPEAAKYLCMKFLASDLDLSDTAPGRSNMRMPNQSANKVKQRLYNRALKRQNYGKMEKLYRKNRGERTNVSVITALSRQNS